jgi:polyhydroxybutyrate depolymerase
VTPAAQRLLVALALASTADCGGSRRSPTGADDSAIAAVAPSAGCGRSEPPGAVAGTIEVAGVARTYLLVVPASYDPTRPTPVIFAWHGRTGTAAGARTHFGLEAVATDALVVYPQGLAVSADPDDFGWELSPRGRDLAFYDALSARLRATYCVGPAYAIGHSFGAFMAHALACYRGGTDPGQVRAIAAVAGGGPPPRCPRGPVAALIVHGVDDPVVPFARGEASREVWRAAAGCAVTTTAIAPGPCVAYAGCAGGLSVRWCAHAEPALGGHGWPRFAAAAAWSLFQATP